jgi:hypothetical protein
MGMSAMAARYYVLGSSNARGDDALSKLLFSCKTEESRSLASLGMTIDGDRECVEESAAESGSGGLG